MSGSRTSSKFVHKETATAACESGSLETVRFFDDEQGVETGSGCMEFAAKGEFASVVQYLYARQTDDVHNR